MGHPRGYPGYRLEFLPFINTNTKFSLSKVLSLCMVLSILISCCLRIIPGDRAMLSQVWSEMDVQLSNYVRGKVLEIFIVGVAAAILFASFGLNYSALLAVLVGISV